MKLSSIFPKVTLAAVTLSYAQSPAPTAAPTVVQTLTSKLLQVLTSAPAASSSASPAASPVVPTWSISYAFGFNKPHNSFAIICNTFKARSAFLGIKNLSGLLIGFTGTQVQTGASTAPQGLTAGLGGELAYSLGGNLFASGGLGYAFSAGQQGHFDWLLGTTLKF